MVNATLLTSKDRGLVVDVIVRFIFNSVLLVPYHCPLVEDVVVGFVLYAMSLVLYHRRLLVEIVGLVLRKSSFVLFDDHCL